MTRRIVKLSWEVVPIDITLQASGDLLDWLLAHAVEGDTLLAHAVDGVIWGKVVNKHLLTSHGVDAQISPKLRIETLQQLRLFNASRELLIWNDGESWQARQASDIPDEGSQTILEEYQILWGTKGTLLSNGFTLLEDGSQGLCHIVPIDASKVNENNTRACMKVHYYLNSDSELGVTSIVYSRLAGLEVVTYG